MSSSESWDLSAVTRAAEVRPTPPADLSAPGQEAPAPSPEQARAAEAVFSQEENAEAGALMGIWSAGMLLNDLIRDAAANLAADDDKNDQENKPRL